MPSTAGNPHLENSLKAPKAKVVTMLSPCVCGSRPVQKGDYICGFTIQCPQSCVSVYGHTSDLAAERWNRLLPLMEN